MIPPEYVPLYVAAVQEQYRLRSVIKSGAIVPVRVIGDLVPVSGSVRKPLPANCDNCGAPTTGPVCEYCGTHHKVQIA